VEVRIKLGRVFGYDIPALFSVTQKCTKMILLKISEQWKLNMNKCKFTTMSSFRKHNSSLVFIRFAG
jgi:hypothetical protein